MNEPPKKLSAEARDLWGSVAREFAVRDAEGLRLLLTACEALDSMRAAERQIAKDGLTCRDRYGGIRSHPLLGTVRDSRMAMLLALKRLGLDPNPAPDRKPRIGRPPGSRGAG
jgi:P27 family predicted phage terminase small subunit